MIDLGDLSGIDDLKDLGSADSAAKGGFCALLRWGYRAAWAGAKVLTLFAVLAGIAAVLAFVPALVAGLFPTALGPMLAAGAGALGAAAAALGAAAALLWAFGLALRLGHLLLCEAVGGWLAGAQGASLGDFLASLRTRLWTGFTTAVDTFFATLGTRLDGGLLAPLFTGQTEWLKAALRDDEVKVLLDQRLTALGKAIGEAIPRPDLSPPSGGGGGGGISFPPPPPASAAEAIERTRGALAGAMETLEEARGRAGRELERVRASRQVEGAAALPGGIAARGAALEEEVRVLDHLLAALAAPVGLASAAAGQSARPAAE